jgi:hypothetical protein
MGKEGRGNRSSFFPVPSLLFLVLCIFLAVTCSCSRHAPARKSVTLWQRLGSWSGHDNLQTGSFVSNTGYLRITWETSHETKPNAGTFRLNIMSSISGRSLLTAVDVRGVAHDTAFVNEDPRPFYAVVESSNVDWKFTVDEGIPATVEDK